jgi:hypothetical protein
MEPKAELSSEEKLTNAETMRHVLTVRALLMEAVGELVRRSQEHDLSKFSAPEVDSFVKYTPLLKGLEYGSAEYYETLAAMKPAIDNHYAHNSHHPEHFQDGILGMDLFDLLEMMIDWKAATLRHGTGDINDSLVKNAKRHQIPEPLVRILANTIIRVEAMSASARIEVSYPKM